VNHRNVSPTDQNRVSDNNSNRLVSSISAICTVCARAGKEGGGADVADDGDGADDADEVDDGALALARARARVLALALLPGVACASSGSVPAPWRTVACAHVRGTFMFGRAVRWCRHTAMPSIAMCSTGWLFAASSSTDTAPQFSFSSAVTAHISAAHAVTLL
jgi:hypothetical protein